MTQSIELTDEQVDALLDAVWSGLEDALESEDVEEARRLQAVGRKLEAARSGR